MITKLKPLVFCFLVLGFFSGCSFIESRSFKLALQQKNCEEAKNILLRSLRRDLNNQDAKYNLVHSFICSGDLAAAIKQIDAILVQKTDFAYELNFLKGYILGETGEVDPALAAYQKALEINNDIRIKQNMELLLKEQQSGKSGKNKKGKKNKDESESNENSDENRDDQNKKNDNKNSNSEKEKDKEEKGKQNKQKKMSEKQVEKIMKEIDSDEKKIRAQGLKVKSQKGQSNDKNW